MNYPSVNVTERVQDLCGIHFLNFYFQLFIAAIEKYNEFFYIDLFQSC